MTAQEPSDPPPGQAKQTKRPPAPRYQHSAFELIRAGFWLSVGVLIVFPIVIIVLVIVVLSFLGNL